ncbi:NLI interacting factor-like phosphatase family protein [Babesia divergens]|uniref:Mitochondrial import inner membrane translocase subunit TIM50 n=1 Tax=Babesia divergens TaxID=32595 RepID=A0AAD9GGF3_BABDI|nr:NLI interacting factor-like phosphatase family protein [Babesia divergens]
MDSSSTLVCVEPGVCTSGYTDVHAVLSDCNDTTTILKMQEQHAVSFDTMSTAYSSPDPLKPTGGSTCIDSSDENASVPPTEYITAYDDIETPMEDVSDVIDHECGMSYHHNIEFVHELCEDSQSMPYDTYCDTATLTPTSEDEALFFENPAECAYESGADVSKGGDHSLVSSECIAGLLSRYIDSTPALQSTSMRLLITKSAIGGTDMIPSQIIRYNIANTVNYDNLRTYLEMSPVFNCVRVPSSVSDARPTEGPQHVGSDEHLHKLLIVLDLDETLVHMHDRPHDHFDYLVNIVEDDDADGVYDSMVSNPDVVGFIVHPTMQVSLRPGVLEFFKYLRANSSLYQVALYTAGTRHYANAIMHALDPDYEVISPGVRYYRDSCEVSPTPHTLRGVPASRLGLGIHHREECVPPFYLKKDLEIFGWPLERVVFFDNSLLSFMNNPDNGVWIKPWRGVQPFIDKGMATVDYCSDRSMPRETGIPGQDGLYEFGQIVRLLEELKDERDVREALRQRFTLSELVCNTITCMDTISRFDGSATD